MINWNNIGVTIDNHALHQINNYFKDLEQILKKQSLSYKKKKVFDELENHIIDYISNNKIKTIDYATSQQLLNELGPPEEYSNYSTIPSLIEQANKKKIIKTSKEEQSTHLHDEINNLVLCSYCNTKNEISSNFCIYCGNDISNIESKQTYSIFSAIYYLVHKKKFYLFNMVTIYLISGILILSLLPISSLIGFIFLIFINELIVIPLSYIYSDRINKGIVQEPIYLFLSHLIKAGVIILPLLIVISLLSSLFNQFAVILYIISLLFLSILFTKIIFFSSKSKKITKLHYIQQRRHIKNLNLGFEILLLIVGMLIVFSFFNHSIGPLEIMFIESISNEIPLVVFGVEALIDYSNSKSKAMPRF